MLHDFLTFFETIPSSYRSLMLVSGVVFFWALEGAIPLFSWAYRRYRHAALNLVFTLTTLVVNLGLAFLIVWAADWTGERGFGVLYLVELPLWVHVLGGLLLLDLIGAWFIHWLEHRVRWMWKFHLIHHTDTHVDVTTALRHHPGESVFRALFTVLAILVAGVPIGVVFLYQTFSALFSQFNHANISLPGWLDRGLSFVFVTPDMHKVHHHWVQPQTDTNYGNIFSLWDRWFGTYDPMPATEVRFGIDTHMDPEEHDDLVNLMGIPFQTYRPPTGAKFSDPGRPSRSGPPGTGPVAVVLLLLLLSGCSGSASLTSAPVTREIEVDADVVEWFDHFNEIADTRLRVGVQHDADYLYLAVVSTQRATVQQIAREGLTIWFDTTAGKQTGYGLRYPVGPPPQGGPQARTGPDRDPGLIDLFFEVDKPIRRPVASAPGLQAHMGFDFGAFTMELRIPRHDVGPDGFHVHLPPGATVQIGFETAGPDADGGTSSDRGAGGRDMDGARGNTGGFGAVGRDFGGRGAGGPSPLFTGAIEAWIGVTLPE